MEEQTETRIFKFDLLHGGPTIGIVPEGGTGTVKTYDVHIMDGWKPLHWETERSAGGMGGVVRYVVLMQRDKPGQTVEPQIL